MSDRTDTTAFLLLPGELGLFVRDGVIMRASSRGDSVLGYTPSALDGRPILELIHPEDRATFAEVLARVPALGGAETEGRAQRTDGAFVACAWRITADPERGLTSLVARDLTERRELDRLKREFVSTVSHELRTPLTSIRGSLKLLDAGVTGELPAEAKELVELALGSTERLIRLVNDLLDLEKLGAGKLELTKVKVSARALAEKAASAMRGLSEERAVALEVVADDLPVLADEDRVLQVLANLLSNALKFSSPGAAVRVVAERAAREGYVRFAVVDAGPGIPPDRVPRLFGRFEQLDQTRAKGGTGLGLAISKALVDAHGGRIGVDTRPGRGSTFWFELELAPSTGAVIGTADDTPRLVLLVSERAPETALLALLAVEGCSIVQVAPPEVGRALDRDHPSALVLELGEGTDVAAIRSEAGARDVPVIVLGRGGEGFGSAFVDWLPTPLDPRRLARALQRATRGKGAPRVLVVDDDLTSRKVAAALLRPLAIECLEAKDGLEGIRKVREEHPDLLVLDVDMPHANGFDVISVLRQERARSTPVLVYSDRDLDAQERERLRLGVTRYLTKARVSEERFVEAVRELLHDVADPFDSGPTAEFPVPVRFAGYRQE